MFFDDFRPTNRGQVCQSFGNTAGDTQTSSSNRRSALVAESSPIIGRNRPKSTISGSLKSVSVTPNIDLIGRCRVPRRTVWRLFLVIWAMDRLRGDFWGLTRLGPSPSKSPDRRGFVTANRQTNSQNLLRRVGRSSGKRLKLR